MREMSIEDRLYEAENRLSYQEALKNNGNRYANRHAYLGRMEWNELQASRYMVERHSGLWAPKNGEVAEVYGLSVFLVDSPSHFFVAGTM